MPESSTKVPPNARIVFRVARIASLDPKRNLAVIGEFDGIAEEIDNYRARPTRIARDPTLGPSAYDAFQLQIVLAGALPRPLLGSCC